MPSMYEVFRKRWQLEQSLSQDTYTAAEAAEAMRVGEKRVRALMRKGESGYAQPTTRTIRIPRQAIVDYLAPSPFENLST